MKRDIKLGFTDYTALVYIPDPASTDGSGKTGLVATNLTVSYTRVETDNDVTVTDVTGSLNNLAALTSAHNDWGLLEVSNTLAPGLYRLDIADAVFASGAWSAVVYVMITTSAAAASPMEFVLVAYDANDTVRLGLTALPNAAADAAGGLPISDAGGLDLDAILSAVDTEVAAIKAKTDNLPSDPADASDIASSFTTVNGKLDTIDDFLDTEVAAILAAVDTEVSAIKTKTDSLTFTVSGQVDANVQSINDALLEGDGSGTPWGPA